MTVTTESGGRQNAFPTEVNLISTKAFRMSLMQKMQRRSMVDGRWSDWLQVLSPMQQQATFSSVES